METKQQKRWRWQQKHSYAKMIHTHKDKNHPNTIAHIQTKLIHCVVFILWTGKWIIQWSIWMVGIRVELTCRCFVSMHFHVCVFVRMFVLCECIVHRMHGGEGGSKRRKCSKIENLLFQQWKTSGRVANGYLLHRRLLFVSSGGILRASLKIISKNVKREKKQQQQATQTQ